MIIPCKDCLERCLGCHGKCERYAAYRSELDRINKARIDSYVDDAPVIRAMRRKAWQKNKIHRENEI